jgi:hypothetical protein
MARRWDNLQFSNWHNNTLTIGGWHLAFPVHYFPHYWCPPAWVRTNLQYFFSDDKQYDVTIGSFPGSSCVYFVAMLASSLGGPRIYVQCKHMYHVMRSILFCGLMEDFIHYYMWSWDEVQHLLQCSKALGFQW